MGENSGRMVQGYECLSSCLGYYFSSEYSRITGSEICLFGGALDITFDSRRTTISTPVYESNYVFLEKNNIPYIHDCIKSDYSDTFIAKQTANKRRLILKVNSNLLNYNRVFKQAEASPHFINIVGETDTQYHVIDCFVPTRDPSTFDGFVDKSEIISAWESKGCEYIALKDFVIDETFVYDSINHNIVKFIRQYGNNDILSRGECAVMELFTFLGNQLNREDLQRITLEINYQLRIYGFISSKRMLAEYFKKQNSMDEEYHSYMQIVDLWNKICLSVVKLGITKKYELYQQIMSYVIETLDFERKLLMSVKSKMSEVDVFCH